MADRVVDVELMYVKDHGSNVIIIYSQLLENGSKRLVSKNVKDIGGYYRSLKPKPIKSTEYLGEVYCGIIKKRHPRAFYNQTHGWFIRTYSGKKLQQRAHKAPAAL